MITIPFILFKNEKNMQYYKLLTLVTKFIKVYFRLLSGMLLWISIPIYYILGFFPRKKNIWLFSAWHGDRYSGKVKYFYDYVRVNHKSEISPIWVAKNKDVVHKIRSNDGVAFHMYSFKGLYYHLCASNYFVSHGINDVIGFLSKGSTITKLGHSTYNYKHIMINDDMRRNGFARRFYLNLLFPYIYYIKNHLKYEIVSSEYTGKYSGSESQNPSIIKLPLGSIKSEYLLSANIDRKFFLKDTLCLDVPYYESIITFFPTWRKNNSFSIFSNDFSLERIERLLIANKCLMFVSFHPYDVDKRVPYTPKSKYIVAINSKMDDVNKLLSITDIFITDYSSLFVDFLIFKKPIVFAKFNNDEYMDEDKGGVNEDLSPPLPGPQVENWTDLEKEIFSNKTDYVNKVGRWHSIIYGNNIGSPSRNIFNFFKDNS